MNFSGFLTAKDFFNYYAGGFLWLLEITILFLPLESYQKSMEWLGKLQNISDTLGGVLMGILLIVVTYIVGFVLTPVGGAVTYVLRRLFGDPKAWVTDYSAKNIRHKGKRLAKTKIRLIVDRLKETFGDAESINETNLKNWFFTIQDYVISKQGEAAAFAVRTQDLFNFTESIILPLPAIFISIGIKTFTNSAIFGWIFIIIGLACLWLLSYRYLKLRFYWVKHIYNTFLAIQSDKSKSEK